MTAPPEPACPWTLPLPASLAVSEALALGEGCSLADGSASAWPLLVSLRPAPLDPEERTCTNGTPTTTP